MFQIVHQLLVVVVVVVVKVGPIKELDAREDVAVGGAKAKDEVLR